MNKTINISILLLLLFIPLAAIANHIHKWTDSSGVVHYTDDVSKVPAQYREHSAMELDELKDSHSIKDNIDSDIDKHGEEMWTLVCAQCHFAGRGYRDGLIGLGYLTVDPITKFPKTAEEIVPRLKHATSGRRSDMDRLDISDEELLNVARYLLELQEK
ncbi:MAG: DUF4124 domain-containing protein [Mariprofundaceae bacterium]